MKDELAAVNMGIAIVTPIQEVLNVINSKPLVNMRQELDRRMLKELAPTLDTTVDEPV